MKSITSVAMNIPAITLNEPSLSSEHLRSDIMPWILLQSLGKSPKFTNHYSSMYPKGNTQLQIRKWWVPLRSELYLSYFFRLLSLLLNNSTRCTTEKTLKETVQFFKTLHMTMYNRINRKSLCIIIMQLNRVIWFHIKDVFVPAYLFRYLIQIIL